jgi:HK97 family phage prohead protease
MPYFITDEHPDCGGWATVKDDGELMGCHQTKQAAIDQGVAIALSEGSTFEGERGREDKRDLPDNYRPAVSDDVPEGRACGNCVFYNEDRVNPDGVRVWCDRWDDWVRGDFYCNAWEGREDASYHDDEDEEGRSVDLTVPAYIRAAARQGLEYHREGKSGAGVVARTIREATAMSDGNITEDKVVRASAWAARHRPDLDAEGARPGQDGYPTPGAVAHLLWGIPTGERYADAVAWFDRKSEQVKADRSSSMEVTPVTPRTKGSEVEFRSFTGELRAEGDGNTFVGYAAVFNSPSEPLPFIERIAPGAFSKTLRQRKRDIRLYVNHDSNLVLASRRSGTLRITEDDIGLRVEADLPDTTAGRDIRELMRTGVVDKMSFGFQVDRRGDKWSDDGMERTLTSVRLFEVSIVTGFPAYEQTTAAVRSLHRLSERTGIAVDELSEALDLLADGAELPADKAQVLMDAIKVASPEPEPQPEPEANLLALKQKQVDLLGKKFG